MPDTRGADDIRCSCAVCRGRTHAELDALLVGRIRSVGFAMQPVVGATLRESWTYTIGLGRSHGMPELLIAGMRPDPAAALLGVLIDEFVEGGLPVPGRELQHRLELLDHGHEFCLLAVDSDLVHRSTLLAAAHCLSDEIGPPRGAVQVVLCDGRGRFPWQVGCRNADATVLLDHPLESVRRLLA